MPNTEELKHNIKEIIKSEMTLLISRISEDFVISGGERRDFFFSMPVSTTLRKPHFAIYKNGETIGPDISR